MRVLLPAVSAAALFVAALPAMATTLTIAPAIARPDASVVATGASFGDSEAVDVYFDTTDTLLLVSNATGGLGGSITIPASATPGTHYITAVGRKSGDAAQAALTVSTYWSQQGFSLAHLAWNPYENTLNPSNVSTLGRQWSLPSAFTGATPMVVDGRVIASTNTGVESVNATTGAVIWNNSSLGFVYATPAVAGSGVYVGSGSASFYELNFGTGAVVWSKGFDGEFDGSPAVTNGVVYVGCNDSVFYALQATTGNELWSYQTGAFIDSSPAIVNNIVYFGSTDKNLYALNATTGALIWKYTTGGAVESSPAVKNGAVFFGSDDDNVYAVNAANGSLIWKYTTGGPVAQSPAVANNTVYIGSSDGNFYFLDERTGALIYSFLSDSFPRAAAVANGVVYFTSQDEAGVGNGRLYALDATYGGVLASAVTGGSYLGGPSVANGEVYVSNYLGALTALAPLADANPALGRRDAPDPKFLRPDPSLQVSANLTP